MLDSDSRYEDPNSRPKQGEPPQINNLDPYDFDFGRELRIAEISTSVLSKLDNADLLSAHFREFEENYLHVRECTDRDILYGGLARSLQATFEGLSPDLLTVDRSLRCFRKTSEVAAMFFNHSPEGLSDAYKNMVVTAFEIGSVLSDRVGASAERLADFDGGLRALTTLFSLRSPGLAPKQTLLDFADVPVSDFVTSTLDEYVAFNGHRNFPDDYHAHEISVITAVVDLAAAASLTSARELLFGMFVRLDYWGYLGSYDSDEEAQDTSHMPSRLTPELEKLYLALIEGIRHTAELNLTDEGSKMVRKYLWSLIDERTEEWIGFGPVLSTLFSIDSGEVDQVKAQLLSMLVDPALNGERHLFAPLLSFMRDGRDHLELVSSILRELGGDDAQRFYSLLSDECGRWKSDGRAGRPIRPGENQIDGISAKLEALVSRPAGSYFDFDTDKRIY